jgi:hypothetical protein
MGAAFPYGGRTLLPGHVYELPTEVADALQQQRLGEIVADTEPAKESVAALSRGRYDRRDMRVKD